MGVVKQGKATAPSTLARLKRQLHALDIPHTRVADEARKTSRRGTVNATTVSNVLAGRRRSANVVATAKRLIAEAKTLPDAKAS